MNCFLVNFKLSPENADLGEPSTCARHWNWPWSGSRPQYPGQVLEHESQAGHWDTCIIHPLTMQLVQIATSFKEHQLYWLPKRNRICSIKDCHANLGTLNLLQGQKPPVRCNNFWSKSNLCAMTNFDVQLQISKQIPRYDSLWMWGHRLVHDVC